MLNYTVLNNRFYSANLITGGADIRPKEKNIVFMLTEHVDDDNFIYQNALQYVKMPMTSMCFYGKAGVLWRMCSEALNRQVYPEQQQRRFQGYDLYTTLDDFITELQNCLETREMAMYDIFLLYDDAPLYEAVLHDPRIKQFMGKF